MDVSAVGQRHRPDRLAGAVRSGRFRRGAPKTSTRPPAGSLSCLTSGGPRNSVPAAAFRCFENDRRAGHQTGIRTAYGGGRMRIGSDSRKRGARAWTVLVIVVAAVMAALIAVASTAAATPGGLDPAYGTGGKTTVNFAADDLAFGSALQSDGSLITVGRTSGTGVHDMAVSRLTPGGAPDPAFGSGGKTTIDFAGGNDKAYAVAVAPDGTIIVAGQTSGGGRRLAVRDRPADRRRRAGSVVRHRRRDDRRLRRHPGRRDRRRCSPRPARSSSPASPIPAAQAMTSPRHVSTPTAASTRRSAPPARRPWTSAATTPGRRAR